MMLNATQPNPKKSDDERDFLKRVKGNIHHVNDPKVQRMVREIDDRERRLRRHREEK